MQLKPLSSYSIHSLYSKPNNRHVQLHSWRFSVSSAVNNADVWLLSAPRAVGSDWSRLTAEHVFCSTDSLAWGPECQSVSWSVCPTLQCRERWHDGRLLSCAYTFIIPEMRIPTVLLLHLHQVTKRKKKMSVPVKKLLKLYISLWCNFDVSSGSILYFFGMMFRYKKTPALLGLEKHPC